MVLERELQARAVSHALEVIKEKGEIPTVSKIARGINYSRTAVQNEVGSHGELVDLCWSKATVDLVRESKEPSWPGPFQPEVVRHWKKARPHLLNFVTGHTPSMVLSTLVILVLSRVASGGFFAPPPPGTRSTLVLATPQLLAWIGHLQFRAGYYASYMGPMPVAIDAAFRRATRDLVASMGDERGTSIPMTEDQDPTPIFDEVTAGFFTPTGLSPTMDAPSTMIPAPGYFTQRVEATIDRMHVEAQRLDQLNPSPSDGVSPSAQLLAYQWSLQYLMGMAQLSANYYLGMAQTATSEPEPMEIATETPPPAIEPAPVAD